MQSTANAHIHSRPQTGGRWRCLVPPFIAAATDAADACLTVACPARIHGAVRSPSLTGLRLCYGDCSDGDGSPSIHHLVELESQGTFNLTYGTRRSWTGLACARPALLGTYLALHHLQRTSVCGLFAPFPPRLAPSAFFHYLAVRSCGAPRSLFLSPPSPPFQRKSQKSISEAQLPTDEPSSAAASCCSIPIRSVSLQSSQPARQPACLPAPLPRSHASTLNGQYIRIAKLCHLDPSSALPLPVTLAQYDCSQSRYLRRPREVPLRDPALNGDSRLLKGFSARSRGP